MAQLHSALPPGPPLIVPERHQNINTSSNSVLIVEDDESLLNYFCTALKNDGYTTRTAGDREEGLRLYRTCAPFSAVLINHCVSNSSGIALAQAIREISPSQGMIIAAFDYRDEDEVPRPEELTGVSVIVDITRFRTVLAKLRIEHAIKALTQGELVKLERYGDWRVRGLGRAAKGRSGADLLAEAQFRTLSGATSSQKGRHWGMHIDFLTHLTGAMRSISNQWQRECRDQEQPYLASELARFDDEGREVSPLDDVADVASKERVTEREEQDRILGIFRGDPEAIQVIQGLWEEMSKHEILKTCGLTQKQYDSTVKRIRVRLTRKDPRDGGQKYGK